MSESSVPFDPFPSDDSNKYIHQYININNNNTVRASIMFPSGLLASPMHNTFSVDISRDYVYPFQTVVPLIAYDQQQQQHHHHQQQQQQQLVNSIYPIISETSPKQGNKADIISTINEQSFNSPSASYDHIPQSDQTHILIGIVDGKEPEDKKGNAPWTIDEDFILLTAQRQQGNNWVNISKELPGRSRLEVKTRFRSISRAYRRIWKPREDEILLDMQKNKKRDWLERVSRITKRSKHAIRARFKELRESKKNLTLADFAPGAPEQIFYQTKYQNPFAFFTSDMLDLAASKKQSEVDDGKQHPARPGSETDSVNFQKRKKRKTDQGHQYIEQIPSPNSSMPNPILISGTHQLLSSDNIKQSELSKTKRNEWFPIAQKTPDEGVLVQETVNNTANILQVRAPEVADMLFSNQAIHLDENEVKQLMIE